MDRLVCGDGGLAKTEVAIPWPLFNGGDSRQSRPPLLAPTTVLAHASTGAP